MNKELEYRSLDFEVRNSEDNENELIIEGYIAKFDTQTELWEGYYEKIDRKAFNDTLKDGHNIFLLYHHDFSKPLASTRNKTLELNTDKIGLKFRATINKNLTYASDVYELVKSGEVRGCSFGFRVKKHNVEYDSKMDKVERTLLEIELIEGTITPIPAYEDTEVQARAKEYKNKFNRENEEIRALTQEMNELELFLLKKELEGNVM